jgi:hypothetical protein
MKKKRGVGGGFIMCVRDMMLRDELRNYTFKKGAEKKKLSESLRQKREET